MWSKIADEFPSHPKIAQVGPLGAWLQVQAICYCSRYLTDGYFSVAVASQMVSSLISPFQADLKKDGEPKGRMWNVCVANGMMGSDIPDLDWFATMQDAGLWDNAEGGFLVHDYLKYNPSKAEVLAERAARSQAGKAGANSRWHGTRHSNSHDKCHSDGKSHGTCDGKQIAKSCPVPVPVPEGKNGKGTDSGIPVPVSAPQPSGAPAATPPAAPAASSTSPNAVRPPAVHAKVSPTSQDPNYATNTRAAIAAAKSTPRPPDPDQDPDY